MPIYDRPIDRAQLCATQLRAINELITLAADGSQDMGMVNPNNLSMLFANVIEELDEALRLLSAAPPGNPRHLSSVPGNKPS